jgi:hypothetical protein
MIKPNSWGRVFVLPVIAFGTLFLALPSRAQQPTAAPAETAPQAQPKAAEKTGDTKDPAIQEQKSSTPDQQKRENDRLFYLLPNYLTVENSKKIPPLTTGQKFKLVALGTFDPIEYPYVGILAGINQAENSDPSYGQGFKGYAKRYGAAFADTTIENFMVGAVFPSMLHQDPRYFQSGQGGFWHRAAYAGLRIFITRTDSGRKQFNYSEWAGSAVAAALSTTYHPAQDRNALNAANVWVTQLWGDALSFEIKEFWPDIKRKLHKK